MELTRHTARISRLMFSLTFIIAGLGIAGCGTTSASAPMPSATTPAAEYGSHTTMVMPGFLSDASTSVKTAYQYATDHMDELAKYPCFCGCGRMGHTSNLSCYIKAVAADGQITYDNHAAYCGVCVDITRDVMRLKHEGQKSSQVRAYIDAQYSSFGPSTNTPLPID
jgi:hypothetical protein